MMDRSWYKSIHRVTAISIFMFILLTRLIEASSTTEDPYKVLGINRRADTQEIRRAYKQLAKEWHPDKNQDPEAQNKFMQITKAHELLSDPDRRRLFDQRGITEDYIQNRASYESGFHRFDPIDEILTFTAGGSFHHPFGDGIAFLRKKEVKAKTMEQNVIPKSNTVPQLVLFYGDWCPSCARSVPVWRTLTDELEGIGMDVVTVHAEKERTIARKLGISTIPAVVLLLETQPHHFKDAHITGSKVIAFIRSKLPPDIIQLIDNSNIDDFLSQSNDNRVRVIIFGTGTSVRLRYMILAFQYRERAAFGFVHPSDYVLRSRFGIQKSMDSIMIFKETPKPVASLSMGEIPYNLMKDLVENNKFLILPRLSAQPIMDTLCPTESSIYRRRLCVILLTEDKPDENEFKDSLRKFASQYTQPRVQFAYVYLEKQKDFFNSLVNGGSKASNLVIIWRQTRNRIAFEWVDWDKTNSSARRLDSTLYKLLNEKQPLAYQVDIQELTDEHAQGLVSKVLRKLSLTLEFIRGHLTREMVIQTTSFLATILFIVAGGFIMAYLVRLEEESIQAKKKSNGSSHTTRSRTSSTSNTSNPSNPGTSRSSTSTSTPRRTDASKMSELRVHELRGETYNGLVRLIKPGCRTIILLLDAETKSLLLPKFEKCVYPYRKNKSLQFGFMHVDKGGGLKWYRQLLLLSLPEPRSLNINPRNCVGTVLSLNGFRRYFCVFHATLPSSNKVKHRSNGYHNGAFLGFDSDRSSDDDNSDVENRRQEPSHDVRPNILFTQNLLDNLSNWLDRLFEGSTHRYHISSDWPEFPLK